MNNFSVTIENGVLNGSGGKLFFSLINFSFFLYFYLWPIMLDYYFQHSQISNVDLCALYVNLNVMGPMFIDKVN